MSKKKPADEPRRENPYAALKPISYVDLGPINIHFDWIKPGAEKAPDGSIALGQVAIHSRVVPERGDGISHRKEHRGLELYEDGDEIVLVYMGCERRVHKAQVAYWAPSHPMLPPPEGDDEAA